MASVVLEQPSPSASASDPVVVGRPVALVQLTLPLTVVLVGDPAEAPQMLRQRPFRRPACSARAHQLEINLQAPEHHPARPQSRQSPRPRPRRQRPVRPHAAADALALAHRDLAEKIAGNFARRTIHPKEDLLQIAMIGLIKAARRYKPSRGPFRPYGRTYANGEVTHFLRDHGFMLKVPPSWREIHARVEKALSKGSALSEVLPKLGISILRWRLIVEACSAREVYFSLEHHQSPVDID
jgi:hypothetical protein